MFALITSLLFRLLASSNVDVDSPLIIWGNQSSSLFGYSVLMHEIAGEHVFLIGAPKADTTQGLTSPGAVFRCGVEFSERGHNASCDDWLSVFDSTDDNVVDIETGNGDEVVQKFTETKSNQFFGVTLARSNNSIIGCANLYKDHYGIKKYTVEKRLPIGRCSSIELDLSARQGFMYPCRNVADSHDSYGSCLAGTSIAAHEGEVVVSAPHANNAYGNSFLYSEGEETKRDDILELLTSTWIGTKNVSDDQNFNEYAGYSTVFCDVNGDGTKEIILGMPRAYYYKGAIRVHYGSREEQARLNAESRPDDYDEATEAPGANLDTDLFRNLQIICPSEDRETCRVPQGMHMGSYFGHSLACGDLNNDGYDDLIISAPYHSDHKRMINDIGRVVIYLGNSTDNHWAYPAPNFFELNSLDLFGNMEDSGLFGYSLNCEGDLNDDGIKDLVVGSPYEEGGGAIYIFNGGNNSFDAKYSQRITPTNMRVNLRGFGSSISSGFNLDSIGGHDLLIGAFLSDAAVSLRTIPTINIIPELLLLYPVVNLEDAAYTDPATGESTAGNNLRITITTTGIHFPNNKLKLKWKVILDPKYSDPSEKRVYLRGNRTSRRHEELYEMEGTVDLQSDKVVTLPDVVLTLYIKRATIRDVRDLCIDIEGQLETTDSSEDFSSKFALKYETFRNASKTIAIDTNCNNVTGVCDCDVGISELSTTFQPSYPHLVINRVQRATVTIVLTNKGPQAAYDTTFTLLVPVFLQYQSVAYSGGTRDDVLCDRGTKDSHEMECKVFGAFQQGERIITINFAVNNSKLVPGNRNGLAGEITVSTPSRDPNLSDNKVSSVLEVRQLADVRVDGGADVESQYFTNKIVNLVDPKTLGEIGPEVRHILEVAVEELIDVEFVEDISLEIRWPLKLNGQYVLYITEIHVPEVYKGLLTCDRGLVDQLQLAPTQESCGDKFDETDCGGFAALGLCSINSEDYDYMVENCAASCGLCGDSDPPKSASVARDSSTESVEVEEQPVFGYGGEASLNCSKHPKSCAVVNCHISRLERGFHNKSHVKLEIRARLWEGSFNKYYKVSASSFSQIISVGNDLVLPFQHLISKQINSKFLLPNKRKGLNLITILLSVVGGLLILAVIVLILWKKGFFKSSLLHRTPSNLYQTGARRETFNKQVFVAS